MKTFLLYLFVIIIFVGQSSAQTTEFIYQGNIKDGASAATGSYDFQFLLFDAASGGAQIGSTLTRNSVVVANGLFSVNLDFGSGFPGAERYLEIRVRITGGGGHTILDPRQKVGSSPYSIKSLTAENAAVAQNAITANSATTATTANNALQLGGVAANQFVVTTDTRMTDTRPPTAGSANYIQNQSAAPQAATNFNISGTGSANVFNAGLQFNLNGSRVLGYPGTNNIFVGAGAGNANTTGNNNSFVGSLAGFANAGGARNSFFGSEAGFLPSAGSDNSFFGYQAGRVSSGSSNSFFGSQSGVANAFGSSNSFFGRSAGAANTSGSNNSFFGAGAGDASDVGSDNSFFGRDAGGANTSGDDNSFFGSSVGVANTTGSANSFFGRNSGAANTQGGANSFFGSSAGLQNLTGNFNSFFGAGSGSGNTIGIDNSFFGRSAGSTNSSGNANSFFGSFAGLASTNGNFNSFFGQSSGDSTTSGGENSFFGANAGGGNVNGTNNSYFGRNAGVTGVSGDFNTVIGADADVGLANIVFATAIGAGAVVSVNSRVQLGRIGSDTVAVGALAAATGTHLCVSGLVLASCSSSLRYKENIQSFSGGLDLVKRFRPVTFDWKERKEPDFGLVAEEVAEIDPLFVTHNQKGVIEGVKYDQLTVILINAVKQQQAQIEELKSANQELKSALCGLVPSLAVCGKKEK